MAISIQAPKTFTFGCYKTYETLTITGSGPVTIDLRKVDHAPLTDEESVLVYQILDAGPMGELYPVTLTAAEGRSVLAIRDKVAAVRLPFGSVECPERPKTPVAETPKAPTAAPAPVLDVTPEPVAVAPVAPAPRVKTTYRNDRTGETVVTELTREEVLASMLECPEHFAWFWMAKSAEERRSAKPGVRDMMEFIADSFLFAIGMGLKRPMIRAFFESRRFKIYLSRKGTICLKSGAVIPGTKDPTGDEEYVGCFARGKFLVNDRRNILPCESEFVRRLCEDPVAFLAQASKDMGRCCYCNLPLEDQRSKDVGYGAVCAVRWGLPWGKSYDEKVPGFAQLWLRSNAEAHRDIRTMCRAIRTSPRDASAWGALADALEEAGMPKRPSMPDRAVTIPNV